MISRKDVISFRLASSERRKLKELAYRLSVRESDLLRYAIRSMVLRLSPLLEPEMRGRDLLPVFVEGEAELLRYFELDVHRLDDIINSGCPADLRIESQDLSLLAMSGHDRRYARMRMQSILGQDGDSTLPAEGEQGGLVASLRRYLYSKYVFSSADVDVVPGDRR